MPDEVVERLERLAARAGTSVGTAAVRELAEATRRPTMRRCSVRCPTLVSSPPASSPASRPDEAVMVFDASAALSALLDAGPARLSLAEEQIPVPHLIDAEVASGLRRKVLAGVLDVADGWVALEAWSRLGVLRCPSLYVALAEVCSGSVRVGGSAEPLLQRLGWPRVVVVPRFRGTAGCRAAT